MNRSTLPPATKLFRWRAGAHVIWIGVALHVMACVGVLAVAPGTEANASSEDRVRWIAAHGPLWQANWIAWMGASLSLLAMILVWGQQLARHGVAWPWRMTAYSIVAVGLACDLAGEITLISLLAQSTAMARGLLVYQVLSPGIANGLYCLGGLVLSSAAWRVGWLRGPWGLLGFAIWTVGLLLTVGTVLALAGFDAGRVVMVVTGGAVMALFIPWATNLGWRVACE